MIGRALCGVALAAGVARADNPRRAEQYYHAGQRAYAAQSFDAAAQDFEEAYKAMPIPELAFSAAQAYRRWYRIDPRPEYVVRAVTLYRAYLDKVKSGGRVADASDALDDMQRELDALIKQGIHVSPELAAEHTQLDIDVELGGAPPPVGALREIEDKQVVPSEQVHVLLDGKPARAFMPMNVPPGKHDLHVEAPGYFARDQDAIAVQGNSVIVDVVLTPKPGHIAVATEAGARVEVDGRAAGIAPDAAIEVAAGHHIVAIARRGRELAVRDVTVANDERVAIDVALVPSGKRRALPWLVGGASGLALVAIGSVVSALVEQHDALAIYDMRVAGNLSPSQADSYASDRQWRNDLAATAAITGAAAVVAAGVAVGLSWFDEPDTKAARLVPIGGAGVGGVGVSGRF